MGTMKQQKSFYRKHFGKLVVVGVICFLIVTFYLGLKFFQATHPIQEKIGIIADMDVTAGKLIVLTTVRFEDGDILAFNGSIDQLTIGKTYRILYAKYYDDGYTIKEITEVG